MFTPGLLQTPRRLCGCVFYSFFWVHLFRSALLAMASSSASSADPVKQALSTLVSKSAAKIAANSDAEPGQQEAGRLLVGLLEADGPAAAKEAEKAFVEHCFTDPETKQPWSYSDMRARYG